MVVVDRFSKYAYFLALSHPFSAITVAQVFLDGIYRLHGVPNTIVSDHDKVFLSHFLARAIQTIRHQIELVYCISSPIGWSK